MRENNNKNIYSPPSSLVELFFEQNWIAQYIDLDAIGEKYKGPKIKINDPDDPYYEKLEYEVRYTLRKIFYNKCAYCESRDYKPDVEHYRPKSSVSVQQGNAHGYYWLCYNWSNLLPACSGCNSENGKWAKFPISGTRITQPSFNSCMNLIDADSNLRSVYMNTEGPLLLNPELEAPESYLKLEWNGKLTGTDGDRGKGWTSINTYDLNRGNLIDARATIIDHCKDKIINNLLLYREGILKLSDLKRAFEIQFQFFRNSRSSEIVHSFVYVYLYDNFDDFLISKVPFVDHLERSMVSVLFNNYKILNR